jgi:glycerol kinase
MTGGRVHATDATNASRTMLFDIHRQDWDPELLDLFDVPSALLPAVMDCAADFGATDPSLFGGAIRIAGIAGDQHAATIGQACFEPGSVKSTYGTGCFAMVNTGDTLIAEPPADDTAHRPGSDRPRHRRQIFTPHTMAARRLGILSRRPNPKPWRSRRERGYMVLAFTGLGSYIGTAAGRAVGLSRDTGG